MYDDLGIVVMHPDGTGFQPLNYNMPVLNARRSPDGSKIAFTTITDNADGSEVNILRRSDRIFLQKVDLLLSAF